MKTIVKKNQVKLIILIINKDTLKKKLGYFITDNTSANDTYDAGIIDLIQLDSNGSWPKRKNTSMNGTYYQLHYRNFYNRK